MAKKNWYDTKQSRVKAYERWMKIYKGEHLEVWGQGLNEEEKEKYMILNFARVIVDLPSRILTSKDPIFTVQDDATQEYLDKILFNNKIIDKLGSVISTGQILGGVVIRTSYRKRNAGQEHSEPCVDFIHPQFYEPIYDEWDTTEIKANKLEFYYKAADGTEYKKIELDEYNKYTELFYKKSENDTDFIEYKESIETKHKQGLLIQYVPFFSSLFEFWGNSIFIDIEDVLKEINNRASRMKRVLDIFSSPKLLLPKSIFEQVFQGEEVITDSQGNKYVNLGNDDVYMWDPETDGDQKPEYITWDANLESAFELFKNIETALAVLTDTPTDVLKNSQSASPESGRALKIRFIQTLYKAAQISKALTNPLKKALWQALGLEDQFGTEKIKQEWVEINWISGLPMDEEEITLEIEKYNNKLQSRETTVKKLNNLNSRQLEEELKRIEEDERRESEGLSREFPVLDLGDDLNAE